MYLLIAIAIPQIFVYANMPIQHWIINIEADSWTLHT